MTRDATRIGLRWAIAYLAVAAASFATIARADEPACRLRQIASLDMQVEPDGRVAVPVSIQGHPAYLVADIGANFSLLNSSFARSLGLSPRAIQGIREYLGGGIPLTQYAKVDQFGIGQLPAVSFAFVLARPDMLNAQDTEGNLGADVMSSFDVDFDFGGNKFSIFSQDHCPGHVVYWTNSDSVVAIPIELDASHHIYTQVMLDGKPLRVLLDTGASRTFVNFNIAKDEFGIDENNPNLKSVGEARINGLVQASRYRYPFQTLTNGDVEVRHPDIEIAKYPGTDHVDSTLTLGISVLRQLHIYIAYGEKKLYVSPAEAR